MGFIEKFGLWTEEQQDAGRAVLTRVREEDLRSLRLSFVDQHGLLRGKTIPAGGLPDAFRSGIRSVSTLLSKDTSGTTVFAAFNADAGLGVAEMAGAADVVMVPDPTTFHLVPWAEGTARILCDLRFQNGEQVPFCSRGVFRIALDRAAAAGFGYLTGLEIEFHLYRRAEHFPNSDGIGRCTYPTPVEPINHGNQLLAVILNTSLTANRRWQNLPAPLRLFRTPGVGEVLVKGLDMFIRGFLFRAGVVHRERLTEDVRRAYLAPHPTWSSRTGELVFPREIPHPASATGPVAELLTRLEGGLEQHFRSKPAQIMWAMRDPAFTPAVLEEWHKTLPDAPVTRLDDASHYLQEDAHERIVPQLLSFLADTKSVG